MTRTIEFAAGTFVLLVAGCLSTSPPAIISEFSKNSRFDGTFYWPPAVEFDADGKMLRLVGADDPAVPVYVEQLLPEGGAEPSVAFFRPANGSASVILAATWDLIQRSHDGGRTWEVAHQFVTPNYPTATDRFKTTGADLWRDDPTGAIFVTQLYDEGGSRSSQCFHLSRSLDGGQSWEEFFARHCWPRWPGGGFGPLDATMINQKIATGSPPQGFAYPSALRQGWERNVYVCYSSDPFGRGLGVACVTSFDGGQTFPQRGQVKLMPTDLLARAGRVVALPDGMLVLPIGWSYNFLGVPGVVDAGIQPMPPTVYVSADSGLTWTMRAAPANLSNIEMNPAVVFTPDGTGYFAYRSADQQPYLLRSRDRFETWEGPFRLSAPDVTLAAFVNVLAGDDGHLAFAYLGTRHAQEPQASPANASGDSHWHLFVTTTRNAGAEHPTFVSVQATPQEDPAQVGCIVSAAGRAGTEYGGCLNLQNFISLSADEEGRVAVAFTDGCNMRVGCGTDTDGGFWLKDREAAVAILDRGPGLRANSSLLSLGLVHPQPNPHADDRI